MEALSGGKEAVTIDFESVSKKLIDLAQEQVLTARRPSRADLLEKVKPALIEARHKKVPLAVLTQFLRDNGIPVSVPTLRHYLAAQGVKKKSSKRRSRARVPEASACSPKETAAEPKTMPAPAVAAAPLPNPVTSPVTGKKVAPRLARYRPA